MTGSELKIAIKKLGLTQEEAAQQIGVTRQTLNSWLKHASIDNELAEVISHKLSLQKQSDQINVTTVDKFKYNDNSIRITENQSAYEIDAKGISIDYLQKIIVAQEETISSKKDLINALKEETERLRKEIATLKAEL